MNKLHRNLFKIWDKFFKCYDCNGKHTRLGYHDGEDPIG